MGVMRQTRGILQRVVICSFVLGIGMIACIRSARAGTCPVIPGGSPALAEIDSETRLGFIRERLAEDARRARVWSEGWKVGYGLLTGTQLALVPFFDDEGVRADLYVGAGSSAIGLAALLILPLQVMGDQDALEARLGQGDPEGDPCALLAMAEGMLIRDAENEAEGVSWWMHGANALLNIGAGLILGLGFDRWESGAINAAAGLALGEVMIFTQPDRLGDDLKRYRSGDLDVQASAGDLHWDLLPVLSSRGGGLSLVMSF
jgi:hypothetical protein